MPVCHLGGYYMDFATTRALMKYYEIPDKGVEDERLDYPLNDWLAKNGKREVLAGTMMHPSKGSKIEDGMLLITQQVWFKSLTRKTAMSRPPLRERDVDVAAKQWLINGGAGENEIEWLSVWDTFGLTQISRYAYKNNVKGKRPVLVDMTCLSREESQAYVDAGMPDMRTYFGDELYEKMTAKSRRG